jgi:hypothetical protein
MRLWDSAKFEFYSLAVMAIRPGEDSRKGTISQDCDKPKSGIVGKVLIQMNNL